MWNSFVVTYVLVMYPCTMKHHLNITVTRQYGNILKLIYCALDQRKFDLLWLQLVFNFKCLFLNNIQGIELERRYTCSRNLFILEICFQEKFILCQFYNLCFLKTLLSMTSTFWIPISFVCQTLISSMLPWLLLDEHSRSPPPPNKRQMTSFWDTSGIIN